MENKKSEMSVEYNMDEMKKSLKNLKETECYDVEKYTYSLLHQTRQLEYFYCQLVEEENPEPDQTYYHVSRRPMVHQMAYFNIGRGFPKELMDGHWCYVLKDFGSKMLVIPCTSIKEDSPEATEYELDIRAKIRKYPIRSRMQLSDMRVVDLQRLDIRKRFCNVITDKKEIERVITRIEGSYALCIVSTIEPDKVFIAKKDSPLVIGKTADASVAASDIPAILDYTKDVYFLEDYEIAILNKGNVSFFDQYGNPIEKEITTIPYDNEAAQKGGYDTFMLKEIHEQPYAIAETLRGRVEGTDRIILPELDAIHDKFKTFNKAYFVACGTAYHACLSGANILERLTGIPTFTQVASEFRYCDPIVDEKTMCVFVSQSGETADTMAALRLAKEKGCTTIAVANVLGSSISREADHTIYTCAGPEIAVASTKAYTTQLIVLLLLGMYISQALGNENEDYKRIIEGIASLPQHIENILKDEKTFEHYASYLKDLKDTYYIGRSLDYATVLEGALKLKEVSYVHADAYIAGELKHGPIALIEQGSLVIAVATQPNIAAKTISNIQETIARGANVILFTIDGQEVGNVKETYILPDVDPILQSVLVAVPLQLIAYYAAGLKGCDVDKPRNLAKSVTVE